MLSGFVGTSIQNRLIASLRFTSRLLGYTTDIITITMSPLRRHYPWRYNLLFTNSAGIPRGTPQHREYLIWRHCTSSTTSRARSDRKMSRDKFQNMFRNMCRDVSVWRQHDDHQFHQLINHITRRTTCCCTSWRVLSSLAFFALNSSSLSAFSRAICARRSSSAFCSSCARRLSSRRRACSSFMKRCNVSRFCRANSRALTSSAATTSSQPSSRDCCTILLIL